MRGRRYDACEAGRNRRGSVTGTLAERTVVVMMVLVAMSGLFLALVVMRDPETDMAELPVVSLRRGHAIRNRNNDLNGHRQNEKQSCQPPPGHEKTNLSFENAPQSASLYKAKVGRHRNR